MKSDMGIVLRDDIQEIFDSFAAAFGVTVAFFSLDGEILTRGLKRGNCRFCELVQRELFGRDQCLTMDETKREEAARTGKIVSYRCHAGLDEAIAPIYAEKSLVGFAMIGQSRSTRKLAPDVRARAMAKGLLETLEKAFAELPYFPPENEGNVLSLFRVLVDYIMTKELVTLKGDRILRKALAFMKANLDRKVSLSEVARAVGRSESGLSHLFKSKLNTTFKRSLIEMKLDAAETLFRTRPEWNVSEIAARLGFDDPFYFSRVFREVRGISPSERRRALSEPR